MSLPLPPLPAENPFQVGYDTWMAGGVVPHPTTTDDYEARLRNAGWCAARRRYPNGASKAIEQEQPADVAAGDRIRGERG